MSVRIFLVLAALLVAGVFAECQPVPVSPFDLALFDADGYGRVVLKEISKRNSNDNKPRRTLELKPGFTQFKHVAGRNADKNERECIPLVNAEILKKEFGPCPQLWANSFVWRNWETLRKPTSDLQMRRNKQKGQYASAHVYIRIRAAEELDYTQLPGMWLIPVSNAANTYANSRDGHPFVTRDKLYQFVTEADEKEAYLNAWHGIQPYFTADKSVTAIQCGAVSGNKGPHKSYASGRTVKSPQKKRSYSPQRSSSSSSTPEEEEVARLKKKQKKKNDNTKNDNTKNDNTKEEED